jgi:cell division protein FtsL
MRKTTTGRRGPPVIRMALLMAGLLTSLTLVVWRQSEALEVLRAMEAVHQERIIEEARLSRLSRRVEELESRGRVSAAARDRLGMRVPTGSELVILPLTVPTYTALAAARSGRAEGGEG